jgi:hypothetical protein
VEPNELWNCSIGSPLMGKANKIPFLHLMIFFSQVLKQIIFIQLR